MEIQSTLKDIWNNPFLRKISSKALLAAVIAALIHPLAAAGLALPAAAQALAQIGFVLGQSALEKVWPAIVAAAQGGQQALADWLEKALADTPELNEAAARLVVHQARPAAESLHQVRPQDQDAIAADFGRSLADYGGALAVIADQYAAALREVSDLEQRVQAMQARLDVWSKQTMEAKRDSLILHSKQTQAGAQGEQRMLADDHSRIIGSEQSIRGSQANPKN